MKLYVVVKCYYDGPEAACLGAFKRKRDAIEAIESDEEWNEDFRDREENLWANDECCAKIEEIEVE